MEPNSLLLREGLYVLPAFQVCGTRRGKRNFTVERPDSHKLGQGRMAVMRHVESTGF